MRIKELQLKSFRGFKELTLKFSSNLAVLIGVNGSGKSTILDSISIIFAELLSEIIRLINQDRNMISTIQSAQILEYPSLEYSDLNHQSTEITDIEISLDIELNDPLCKRYHIKPLLQLDDSGLPYEGRKIADEFEDFINRNVRSNGNIPIFIHYKNNWGIYNISIESPEHRLRISQQYAAFDGCFAIEHNNFKSFFQWFRNQEDLENEKWRDGDRMYEDKQLSAVKNAIYILLDNFTDLRVEREFLEMTVKKDGKKLVINQLSDGEKSLLVMVGDIARRLSMANPSLDNPLQGEGIVLIDEIELHLHPQWQRRIIPALTSTFPNCQFIVTTHSPQVLSEVEKENVFILEDFKLVEITPHTKGRDSNSILSELMRYSERSPEIQKQIDSCMQLIDDDKIDEARNELKKLSDLLGQNDPEVVRANTLIDFFHRK
jgi:predicted ATP-binding protein involved in virulence